MRLGLVCGMKAEARALGALRRHPDLSVAISAAKPDRATLFAEQMVRDRVDCLISWGIAGGLAPDILSGALLVPEAVIDTDGGRLALTGLTPAAALGPFTLLGSDTVIASPEQKAALHDTTGATAVDMETHRVARIATEHGVPCIAIRAVSDPADRALPPGTEDALDDSGRPKILPVLAGLARHPSRLPALLSAKRDLDCALQTLSTLGAGLIEEMLAR